jgi:hypothetical protein
MVTDSAQKRTLAFGQPPQGFVDRASRRARQFLCGLSGHDSLLHFQRGRISLVCVLCGHETPGWDLGGTATARNERGASQSVQVPLVGQQRAA